MNILLARHGNTFNAGESAYYVGSQQDLPLVAFGETQARHIGDFLAKKHPDLAAVYTGPLLRMTTTAQLALQAAHINKSIQIDPRLNEIDYGLWSGLTSQEVRQRFSDASYEQWEQASQWPIDAAWGESEAALIARIQSFTKDLRNQHQPNETVLVVASNGCLRYFLSVISGAFEQKREQHQLKILTGSLSQLSYHDGTWTLDFWNQSPTALLTHA